MAPQPKGNPLPVDKDVQIPEAVKRAAAAADAAMKAQNPQPPTEPPAPPAPANNETITIAPPPEPQKLPGQVPLTIEPAPPAPPQPEPQPQPQPQQQQSVPEPGSWEHRYQSMHGRFREASNQLQQANARIEALENMLASMQSAPRAPSAAPQTQTAARLITEKDEQEMGPEMIDLMRRAAREELAPLLPRVQEIDELKQRITGVTQQTEQTARQRMHSELSQALPNWQEINHDADFHAWLALQDRFAGVTRHKLLRDAYDRNDTARVLAFFQSFVSETAAQRPAAPTVANPPAQQPERPTLEDLAAPGRARTAASPTAPAEKQIIRTSDVNAFYAAVRKGAYRGREAEQAQLEAELHLAMREGRIVRDT